MSGEMENLADQVDQFEAVLEVLRLKIADHKRELENYSRFENHSQELKYIIRFTQERIENAEEQLQALQDKITIIHFEGEMQ